MSAGTTHCKQRGHAGNHRDSFRNESLRRGQSHGTSCYDSRMPRYDYRCEANGRVVEVAHGMNDRLTTWGEVCARAGLETGTTPAGAPVEKVIHAPALGFPRGNAELKSQGFTKLVRRDDGVYENVTARDGQSKVVNRDDPGSVAGLNLNKTVGD